MRISDYLNDSKRLDFKVSSSAGEAEFWIEYKPNAWNFQTEEETKDLEGFDKVAKGLQIRLKDWDLTDDNDKKIPITVEGMRESGLPFRLLTLILQAINEDMVEDKTDSKND